MWIANALGGAMVFCCGLITRLLKAGYLVAGYNTMPKEEKAKYDEEALTRFVGNLLMIAAATVLVPLVVVPFLDNPDRLIMATWVMFAAAILGGLVYANTGKRFMKRR